MIRGEFTVTDWRKAKMLLQSAEMVVNISAFYFEISLPLSYVSYPSIITSSSFFLQLVIFLFFSLHDDALREKFQQICCCHFAVQDGGLCQERRGKYGVQRHPVSLFFYLARLPTAERRSTLVRGGQILLPAMAKAMLMLMDTTDGSPSDPVRVKAVTDYPRDLLPTNACASGSCTLPGVDLLVVIVRFGKYFHTRLNLFPDGVLVHTIYWIERIPLS